MLTVPLNKYMSS